MKSREGTTESLELVYIPCVLSLSFCCDLSASGEQPLPSALAA